MTTADSENKSTLNDTTSVQNTHDQSLSDFIAQARARFEARLETTFTRLESFNTSLIDAMRYSALGGGKRVRPLLVYASAHAIDAVGPAADDFAAAVECVHVYSLIHDDLPAMDDDNLRRGKATSHIAFNEATAILAGDALQALAFEIIASSEHASDKTKLAAVEVMARCAGVRGMVIGQAIDLHFVDAQPSLRDLQTMHVHKTGALIEASVVLGALSAGAEGADIDKLLRFARAIGLAFQVQDDILDITSDTSTLGKTQGADLERNKPTYVSLLGLDAAREKARTLRNEAITAIDSFGDKANILRALADYIVSRDH